jgi:tetratricopeptide (TPR) repeat protein
MFAVAREQLAHVYVQQGKYDDAVAEFELAAATGGASDRAQLAYGYAVSDRRAEATAILSALLAPGTTVYTPPFSIAMAYVGLGDADEAFRWLEQAYADRDPWLITLNGPPFEPLRADLRFAALLRKMGIEP